MIKRNQPKNWLVESLLELREDEEQIILFLNENKKAVRQYYMESSHSKKLELLATLEFSDRVADALSDCIEELSPSSIVEPVMSFREYENLLLLSPKKRNSSSLAEQKTEEADESDDKEVLNSRSKFGFDSKK